MKRFCILCFLIPLLGNATISANLPIRGHVIGGLDVLFGDISSSRHHLAGVFIHGGYDIFFPKLSFFSIEPKVGVGFFGSSKRDAFDVPVSDYSIIGTMIGIAPKLHLSVNADDDAFLFLEHEFSLMNMYANIKDKDRNTNKRRSKGISFYYSLKVGLRFRLSSKYQLSAWVGGNTLNFNKLLNKNIPAGTNRYSSEAPSYAAGVSFYL
ncbi:Uncharacterised protein [Bacteroides heparinolyticus]|uniref:Outer membrane protein beta-barrel domain-containing protein n=1 Tax=Prevotella heparinolytica TaxID=28113 RepID=A0A449HZR3_9BACE|nr:hypothetical protein [Bacteroides heparinolyticus]VFB12675.1 Uncharacterised protein [Bacteroides heparinolyticus]